MAAKTPVWVKRDTADAYTTSGQKIHCNRIVAYFGPADSANDIDSLDTWSHGATNVVMESIDPVAGAGTLSLASSSGIATFVSSAANQSALVSIYFL